MAQHPPGQEKAATGVIIGKFYPPHLGHKFLIETALGEVQDLMVIVCEHPSQTISGDQRAAWLREIHPGLTVVVTPDDEPDEPEPWARRTIEILGHRPDVVFTSELYGEGYAAAMGCGHRCVDLSRLAVPISASKIRQHPFAFWEFMEPCVRAHFVKRVVLIGVESTGKTTLAQELAEALDTEWVAEYGREYSVGKTSWETEDFVRVATEQQRRENEAARRANRILICDTNAVATTVWHRRYMGSYSSEVNSIGARDQADLYLFAQPDFPFVQDGTRDGEFIRAEMQGWFAERLAGREVVSLFGDRGTRLATALTEIRSRFLDRSGDP